MPQKTAMQPATMHLTIATMNKEAKERKHIVGCLAKNPLEEGDSDLIIPLTRFDDVEYQID